ncbi:unnamed protein product [Bursaphelenchus xylophilus]|uniref:(pine wood nematode) hypothetical protein n=1 Tax=Bursaphelenchus xylophilus TaxID=6326 RepID=F2VLM9_BURXY|nr:RNA-binding protein [Bursaphelenchus xylophilus]ADV57657.1 RNA-binding protein [Bursaphelenchus xylophilus]CAD5233916.1 unnamed protein product [Bursaphelenchus xylophilus]CAG9129375.1 unnamed protein product [Bursaphelenchus xylophilus]
MNHKTKIRLQNELNEKELSLGYAGDTSKSWHSVYKESAWIHVGGLDYGLTEGDLLAVFSQYGEICNVNIIRDYKTLKSKGFAFICYQDQRSTVLAVDNFNGIKIAGREIKVDHVESFKPPKYKENVPEALMKIWREGCAPVPINISKEDIERDYERQKAAQAQALAEADQLKELEDEKVKKLLKKMKKEDKKLKKEAKKLKKREKREKKRLKRSPTPLEERGTADSVSNWDQKKKHVDYREMDDEDFYGSSKAFNFGKKRKEIPDGPTHNIRPDFDKADWRDIELFKIMREKEKAEKGEKPNNFKEEEHYLPNRFG